MLLWLPYGTPRPVGRECAEKIKTWFTCYAWGLGCLCSRCVFADIPRVSSADMQGISLRRFFRFLAFSFLLLNPWNSRAAEALASLSLSLPLLWMIIHLAQRDMTLVRPSLD